MAAETPGGEVIEAQNKLAGCIVALLDTDLRGQDSFDTFMEVMYDGEHHIDQSLATIIAAHGKPIDCEKPGNTIVGLAKTVRKKRVVASLEQWGGDKGEKYHEVNLVVRKRYWPLISWRPQEFGVRLREHGTFSDGGLDTAWNINGKEVYESKPLRASPGEQSLIERGIITPGPYGRDRQPDDNVVRSMETVAHNMLVHFRNNVIGTSLWLLEATGVSVSIARDVLDPPPPEYGLRLLRSDD